MVKGWPHWRTLPQRLAPFRTALLVWSARAYRKGFSIFARMLGGKQLLESMRIYSEADLVLSSGGTYLKESYGMDTQIADYPNDKRARPSARFPDPNAGAIPSSALPLAIAPDLSGGGCDSAA